jgi:hypothetical protein
MPVIHSLTELDKHQGELEALGYEWWGEFGLPGVGNAFTVRYLTHAPHS